MAERDTSKWRIDESLVRNIRIVFKTVSTLVAVLDLTTPTWSRLKSNRGVKYDTAINAVKRYFEILREIGEGNDIPDGCYETYANDMLKKYRSDIANHRFEKFVREVTDQPAPEAN